MKSSKQIALERACYITVASFARLTGTYWLSGRVPDRRFSDYAERPWSYESWVITGLSAAEVGQLLGGN